jgi:Leucine-rich repeat (LRR) protein
MLSQLILNGNGLTGTIPQTIVNLGNLTDINLSDNMLRGNLFDVESFRNLREFRVDGNILTGEIPSSFADIGFLGEYVLKIVSN